MIYLAHPLGADTKEGIQRNLHNAKLWFKWACDHYWPDAAFNMSWVMNCEVYDDANAEDRDRGMQRNYQHIKRCDELWLLGPRVSNGMEEEARFARRIGQPVYDLTNEGITNPQHTPRMDPEVMMLWDPSSLTQQAFPFAKPPGVGI
jgi:hypothetical protein